MGQGPSESRIGEEQEAPALFAGRVREAIALLRDIRDNRRLMAELGEEDYKELLTLAGQVARPGPYAKRELAREARKRRKQQLREADERVLAGTGIRAKRRELVYQTPNYSTPPSLPEGEPSSHDEAADEPRLRDARNCYV